MSERLELPTGERVGPEDVFLYNGYPYRFVPLDSDSYEFELSPLYWGDSGMDVPFRDREALVDQWGADSRGLLSPAEWDEWLADARDDERFGDRELVELARELPTDDPPELTEDRDDGGGLRDILGL